MEEFMSPYKTNEPALRRDPRAVAYATWHGLFWLVIANAVGVLIATLLLFPNLNRALGEWTYGRWIIVHMNLELYGWTGLPLVGFLFRIYGTDRGMISVWSRPLLWVWSAALGVGAVSWLNGYSTGKLFLDWSGYARVLFPAALITLWCLLTIALIQRWSAPENVAIAARVAKLAGLALLLCVPFILFLAASPNTYPPVNPDTGGPTGASQLESSLCVVGILLMIPYGIARKRDGRVRILSGSWIALLAEALLCILLGRADVSHHRPAQYLGLGSLLIWLPLMPAYYAAFEWHANTRRWRLAFLAWWAALVTSGWVFFLPGVLDHFKFTDGLVGHSFIAMAGFTSSLIIFVTVQLLDEGGWIFNRARSFHLWNGSVVAYVVLMTIAGWREGNDPAFTIVPGMDRNLLYVLRLISGVLMLLASLDWFVDASVFLRSPDTKVEPNLRETTA